MTAADDEPVVIERSDRTVRVAGTTATLAQALVWIVDTAREYGINDPSCGVYPTMIDVFGGPSVPTYFNVWVEGTIQ